MRRIAYTRADGGVSIVSPAFNTLGEVEGFTEADAEQRAWDRLPDDAIDPCWIDEADLPDRTQRYAWRLVNGVVVVDPEAAPPPLIVSRLRLKIELAERKLLEAVEQAVQAAGAVPQLYWADASEFESNHALVLQIGAAVGLSPSEVREIFEAAVARPA